jgi:hypothetical protein
MRPFYLTSATFRINKFEKRKIVRETLMDMLNLNFGFIWRMDYLILGWTYKFSSARKNVVIQVSNR